MPIDEFTRNQVDTKLGEFCRTRIPPHARDEIRLSYSFWRNSVILYPELRPNTTLEEVIEEVDDDPTCIFWG